MTGETVSILYEAKEVCNLRWWRGYWEAAKVSIVYEANEVCNTTLWSTKFRRAYSFNPLRG